MGDGYSIFYKVVIILGGVYAVLGSIFNWEFFFNSRKARGFVRLMGRTGARIFYGVIGAALIVAAIMLI